MLTRSFMTPSSNKKLVAYTPMFHARMFAEQAKFRDRMFQPLRESLSSIPPSPLASTSQIFLDGNTQFDRPLFVQFCANDPEELLSAARYVAPFCDAVDLNLGCPQGIARRGGYGSFLQEDQDLIFRLINTLHKNLSVPVTAKIRILDTKEKTLAYAKNVLSAGASILTVHGRQREQKGHMTGLADWNVIRYLRENLPKETVLFANGNVLRREDIDACMEATGVNGVMSAEGNLYDPAIFAEAPEVGEEGREYWRGKDGKGGYRADAVLRRYMDIIHKYVLEQPIPERQPLYIPSDSSLPEEQPISKPTQTEEEDGQPPKKKQKRDRGTKSQEKCVNPNLTSMQPHLFHLLRALVSKQHHIRGALARCRSGDIPAFEHVLHLVEVACAKGIKEYDDTDGRSWEEEIVRDEAEKARKVAEQVANRESERKGGIGKVIAAGKKDDEKGKEGDGEGEMDESSLETVRECRRPWWVVQPYVRPLPKEALAKGSLTLSKKQMKAMQNGGEVGKQVNGVKKEGVVDVAEEKKDVGGDGVDVAYVKDVKVGEEGGEKVEIPKDGLVCG